jgi:hypothetical protein
MRPCDQCYALEKASASTEPHGALQLMASVEILSGIREEYVCAGCGQKMIRFRAKQSLPPPSDVWRFG